MYPKRNETPARRGPVAWWKIATGVAAGIIVIDVAQAAHGIASLVILVAGLAAVGLIGWLRGCDSRDGADWRCVPDPGRR
jgi:hypothetical protein